MTVSIDAPSAPTAVPPRRGHRRPVLRFALALGAVGVLLALVAWSGLLWPQVRLTPGAFDVVESIDPIETGGFTYDELPEVDAISLDLGNLGATSVAVRAVAVEVDRPHRVLVVPAGTDAAAFVELDALEPFAPFDLAGGETRTVVVVIDRPCAEAALVPALPNVHVEVASVLGRTRTLTRSDGVVGDSFGWPECG